jgi:hypothetical protein
MFFKHRAIFFHRGLFGRIESINVKCLHFQTALPIFLEGQILTMKGDQTLKWIAI